MADREELLALAERCEKAVAGFGDYYAVTEDGEVWSLARGSWRKLKPTLNDKGYAKFDLTVGGKTRTFRLNRVIAEAFHGPAPFPEAVARHLDDNRSNNCAANIRWGSASDNAKDAVKNGVCSGPANGRRAAKKLRGTGSARAKLDWPKAREIRQRMQAGETSISVAADFGIHHSTVRLIAADKTWREGGDA